MPIRFRTTRFFPQCESVTVPVGAQQFVSPEGFGCSPCLTATGPSGGTRLCCCNDFVMAFTGMTSDAPPGSDPNCQAADPYYAAGSHVLKGSHGVFNGVYQDCWPAGRLTPPTNPAQWVCHWNKLLQNDLNLSVFPATGAAVFFQVNAITYDSDPDITIAIMNLTAQVATSTVFPPNQLFVNLNARYRCEDFKCDGGTFVFTNNSDSQFPPGSYCSPVTFTWPSTVVVTPI